MFIGPFDYITCGFLCPVYFLLGILGPLTFLGHSWLFLILCFHGLLLTSLDFSNSITLSFILRAGLSSTPYFLCLHYFGLTVTHSHFSISRIAHGFTTSLFLGSFRPICFFKAHLFILQACDPLFLPLELNGFFIYLLTLFCLCCWASSSYQASQNEHQQIFIIFIAVLGHIILILNVYFSICICIF